MLARRFSSLLVLPTSFAATGLLAACSGAAAGDSIGADQAAIVADHSESESTDDQVQGGVEDTLSGATPAAASFDLTVAPEAAAANVHTNAGLWFKPAGCIVSTVSGAVVTSVFTDCTGPYGLAHFNGTVVSTWSKPAAGELQVVHQLDGFHVNGATISGTITVDYTRDGAGVFTKHRVANLSGETASGRAITRTADYVTTYDGKTNCLLRNGDAKTTIGARSLDVTVSGYERCGLGELGCPVAGTVTLTAEPSGESLSLTFPGGAAVVVTGPKGGKATLPLACLVASAS
jgi:hypothetical protein